MSAIAPSQLRYSFHIPAPTGAHLPLQQRDWDVLQFIPTTAGTVTGDVRSAISPAFSHSLADHEWRTRSVLFGRAVPDDHDGAIGEFEVLP